VEEEVEVTYAPTPSFSKVVDQVTAVVPPHAFVDYAWEVRPEVAHKRPLSAAMATLGVARM
jgi:hypothetical protein